MIYTDNYAIAETAGEAAVFSYYDGDPAEFAVNPLGGRVSPAQLAEAITPKEGDAVFMWLDGGFGGVPDFYDDDTPLYSVNHDLDCEPPFVKVNALTIGKTVGELRALLEWAKGEEI